MDQHEHTRECGQRSCCRSIYRRLGESKGPSVIWPVLAAFVIPLVTFIVTLVAASELLEGLSEPVMWLAALAIAATVTLMAVWIIHRATMRPAHRSDTPRSDVNT